MQSLPQGVRGGAGRHPRGGAVQDAGAAGGGPGRPPFLGGAPHLGKEGLGHRVFLGLPAGLRFLPERVHQPMEHLV